jgi:DNA topoisomerase-3
VDITIIKIRLSAIDVDYFRCMSKGKTGKIKGLKMPGIDQEIEGKLVMDESFNPA